MTKIRSLEGLYSVLPILYNYFQTLMIAYYAPNRNSQEALAEWLEFGKPWQAKAFMTGMRNYSGIKVLQIISKIREIDAKSKGLDNPNTPSEELMRETIFFTFCTKKAPFALVFYFADSEGAFF